MFLGTLSTVLPAVLLHIMRGLGWSLRVRGKREFRISPPPLRKASSHALCSRPREGGETHPSRRPAVWKPWWQPAWGSAPVMSVLGPPLCSPAYWVPSSTYKQKGIFYYILAYFLFYCFCLFCISLKEQLNKQVVFPSLPWVFGGFLL